MSAARDISSSVGWITWRWNVWALGLLTCGAIMAQPLSAAGHREQRAESSYQARVTRVSDGDTLWVRPLDGGRPRKLRMDGLDAPEICQDGGRAARDALAQRLLNQVVQVQERRRDDYGRAWVRLQHEGDDVGAWLVTNGLAWSYRWRSSAGPYADQEAQARARRKGLFAHGEPELPRQFRRRHGPCDVPGSG